MTAAFIILAIFFGLSAVIATTACCILVANGKLTLPHTNQRRVMRERVELTLAQIRLERESINMRLDESVQLRLERATDPSSREPTTAELVDQGGRPQ